MECCKRVKVIDGYEVVVGAGERTYDPQATAIYINKHFPKAREGDLPGLYKEHKQYAPLQDDEIALPENICHLCEEKLKSLKDGEKLLSDDTIINDHRNKEYWIKNGGRWVKDKILELGVTLPKGAVPADDLSCKDYQLQREEISLQEEQDRLSALTPEQKEKEAQAALDSLADEAARLEKRAQIQGKEFDPIVWYREGKQKLSSKYGLAS